MKILIDTQCWLWMTSAPERLSSAAMSLVQDPHSALYLSAASAWEIAIKYGLGKLRLPQSPREFVAHWLRQTRTSPLSITADHAAYVADLPALHKDPFDRLLIAQAALEKVPILTSDPQLRHYDVEVIDA